MVRARIVNSVRCVPPENKPTPAEINTCRAFLIASMDEMQHIRAVVALGRIAHESFLRAIGAPLSKHPFGHGAQHVFERFTLFDSYHCSRYNTNTGRLTPEMFRSVFAAVKKQLG